MNLNKNCILVVNNNTLKYYNLIVNIEFFKLRPKLA